MALHIRNSELPGDDVSRTFLGRDHGGVPVSFFIQASPPGHGPGPHRHPYSEVFVLHEGSGSFLAGDETIEASGGSVVVVPAGEIHGFTASPGRPLRMTCLHLNDRMIAEWVPPAGAASRSPTVRWKVGEGSRRNTGAAGRPRLDLQGPADRWCVRP